MRHQLAMIVEAPVLMTRVRCTCGWLSRPEATPLLALVALDAHVEEQHR